MVEGWPVTHQSRGYSYKRKLDRDYRLMSVWVNLRARYTFIGQKGSRETDPTLTV